MTRTAKAELTRDAILATGEELIRAKGFTGVGLQEILATCGVPKGSFYHYFPSKEAFGVAVLERYVERYLAAVEALLADGGTAHERIRRLAEAWAGQAGEASAERCLVVKLSAEVSGYSEPLRETLDDGVRRLVALLAVTVAAGHADGSIPERRPAADLAASLYQLWLGAALVDRLRRDGEAFRSALLTTDILLS
ncbi:TetR/AcrR family transcriptional regulator [Microbacterium gilvum]|jgi:TetR/AcrR family transcriptional repressor of nem operon|uniref:TetR/AcrR family transcriptional regulator n=1 Tax=Microbacterium gilvum TaxID=1336204 RepID=A0ABP9A2Q1_9MICO